MAGTQTWESRLRSNEVQLVVTTRDVNRGKRNTYVTLGLVSSAETKSGYAMTVGVRGADDHFAVVEVDPDDFLEAVELANRATI